MITLTSETLRAALDPLGARLAGLWINGWPQSLVLGPPDAASCAAPELAFFGVLVGPIANRVSRAIVYVDGTAWHMQANEGSTCLHSGARGIHARTWQITATGPSATTLKLTLEHGACGLPGERILTAKYSIIGACLELDITATSDAVTPMNIAHHPYWNLSNAPTVADHELSVSASHVLPTDAGNLPTGQIEQVAGTHWDFRRPRPIPTTFPIDANLCLASLRRPDPEPVAGLTAPHGPALQIETTEPGLQVYNGFGLSNSDVVLHPGQNLRPCAGIALESQGWPDAPNQAAFPSILLHPGETYRQITRYRLSF